jgi:nucleotide-binding universal stress UspA family protein
MTVVVLAIDGSAHSHTATSWVASTGALAAPRVVHLVHVSPMLGRTGFGTVDFEQENREQARQAFEAAHRILDGHADGIHQHWLRGDAVESIVGFAAEQNADLLVVGAKGVGPLKAALTGSVVSKVVAQSTVPTVVINSPDPDAAP